MLGGLCGSLGESGGRGCIQGALEAVKGGAGGSGGGSGWWVLGKVRSCLDLVKATLWDGCDFSVPVVALSNIMYSARHSELECKVYACWKTCEAPLGLAVGFQP